MTKTKIETLIDAVEDIVEMCDEYDRMRNCANCDHHEVCVIVAKRKAAHANDYSPCSHWKLVDEA